MEDWTRRHETQTTELQEGWSLCFTSNSRCEEALFSLTAENGLAEDGIDTVSVYATAEQLYKLASAALTVATALVRRTAERDAADFAERVLALETANDPALD